MTDEPTLESIAVAELNLSNHDIALAGGEVIADIAPKEEGRFDPKQLAQELLEKNNIEISDEKVQIISGLIESREKIPDTSEIKSMSGEDLLNLFISLKVNKEVFNFTNKVKYVVKGLTVLKDESEAITKAQVYLSGVVRDPEKNQTNGLTYQISIKTN